MREKASPLPVDDAKLLSVTMLRRFCLRAASTVGLCSAMVAPLVLRAQASATQTPAAIVTRQDVLFLVVGSGLVALAQRSDLAVRGDVRADGVQQNRSLDLLADAGNLWGQPIALGGALGLWIGGRVSDRPTVAATGLRAVEAIAVSGVLGKVAKGAFGRARPRVNGADAWDAEFGRGFSLSDGDHESMPSGHATAAFAFAAAVTSEVHHRAPRHAHWVGVASFGLAAATAYARMHADAHWLSDVTAGAVLGSATGWAVTRWHRTRPGNSPDRWLLGPTGNGGAFVGAQFSWP
jgi:membrane-associated phospholipid phosphatase